MEIRPAGVFYLIRPTRPSLTMLMLVARFAAFLQEEVHHLTSAVFDGGAPVVDGGRAACGQLGADDGESSRAAAVTPEKKSK